MMKDYDENIYEMLNEMDLDISDYENEAVTKDELKRWKKAFHKNRLKNGNRTIVSKVKYVAAAFVIVLGGMLAYNPVKAQMDILTYHIQELMGNDKDLSAYSIAVDQTVTKDGVTVSLGDVIVDEDCMYVTYSVKAQDTKKEDILSLSVSADVAINGIPVREGSRGGATVREDGTEVYAMEIGLGKHNMEKEKHYKITFSLLEDDSFKKIGAISFVASGNQMAKDIKRIDVNQELILENGIKLNIKEYVSNPVQQKLILEYGRNQSEDLNYDITLKGVDNLGRKMTFYLATWDEREDLGKLVLMYDGNASLLDNNMDMTAVTSFTVIPYAQEYPEESGRMNTEIKPIGEEFVIDIQ